MAEKSNDWMARYAFIAGVLLAGFNAIGVRYTLQELTPFWGATLRFLPASIILFVLVAAMRLPLPRGRAWTGSILYGVLNFGASYAFLYWGLQKVAPGLAQVIMALAPLMTLVFAILHRQESFRWRTFAGTLLAVVGVGIVFGEQVQLNTPLVYLLAIVAGAACLAEAGVLVKSFPGSHPITTNAVGMLTGAILLSICALLAGETAAMPTQPVTWLWLAYLIILGSCAVFILFLFVLKRWAASVTAYSFVLFPFVTVAASAWLTGETISPVLLIGAALVLGGVYLGSFVPAKKPSTFAVPAQDQNPPS